MWSHLENQILLARLKVLFYYTGECILPISLFVSIQTSSAWKRKLGYRTLILRALQKRIQLWLFQMRFAFPQVIKVVCDGVEANTILYLDKRDYLFRSFWDREDCYRILNAFLDKFKYGGSRESVRIRTNTIETTATEVSGVSSSSLPPTPATVVGGSEIKSQRRASTSETDDVYDAGKR
jgi:hypothetical protein